MENNNYTDEFKNLIFEKTKGKCAHCGKKITLENMQITKLNDNYNENYYNKVALCESCSTEKENSIYDISYYKHIVKNEKDNYNYTLLESIYNNVNDSEIFGKDTRITYYIPSMYLNKMNSNKKLSKNKDSIVGTMAKKVIFRLIDNNDITEELLELVQKDSKHPDKEINKQYIIELLNISSIYGMFDNNSLLGIISFTNVKNVKLDDNAFLESIKKYKETYIATLLATKPKFESLCECIHTMVSEYMAITNNLVLYSYSNEKIATRNNMAGIPSTVYEAVENMNLHKDIEGTRRLAITLGDAHETLLKRVEKFKKGYDSWKSNK